MTAMEKLSEWCRKGYRFTLGCGGLFMPGDGFYIKLEAARRVVEVDDCDACFRDEDGEPGHGDLEEVIEEAIRRWHADGTAKRFDVFVRTPAVKDADEWPVEYEMWGCKDGTYWRVQVVAENESRARSVALSMIAGRGQIVNAYEKGPA
jgi:hypothetical protein